MKKKNVEYTPIVSEETLATIKGKECEVLFHALNTETPNLFRCRVSSEHKQMEE